MTQDEGQISRSKDFVINFKGFMRGEKSIESLLLSFWMEGVFFRKHGILNKMSILISQKFFFLNFEKKLIVVLLENCFFEKNRIKKDQLLT